MFDMNQLARHPRLAMLLEFPCPLASLAGKVARRQRLAEVDRTLLNIFVSMVDSDLAGTLGWQVEPWKTSHLNCPRLTR